MPPKKKKDKGKKVCPPKNENQSKIEKIIKLGSSTQNNSGSSTPPGPTAQTKPEKISQQFQSSKDYALSELPIETLLGIQCSQNLLSLPSKSWADIAEEDALALAKQKQFDQALALTIQNNSLQISKVEPSSSTPIVNFQKSTYIAKPERSIFLFQTEHGFYKQDPKSLALEIFPLGFLYSPTNITKTQVFYEFILVGSNSVSIKHFPDTNEEKAHAYSAIQIMKVISPKDWGQNLNKIKKFSQRFDPIGYNYWDYIQA